MAEIVMPRLSDTMEEGTILRWLKSDGELLARGEELVEIETDKATMTYESDQQGVLAIVAAEGSTLAVGEVIARIGGERDTDTAAAPAAGAPQPAARVDARRGGGRPASSGGGRGGRRRAGQGLAAGAADRERERDRPSRRQRQRPGRADRQGGRRQPHWS